MTYSHNHKLSLLNINWPPLSCYLNPLDFVPGVMLNLGVRRQSKICDWYWIKHYSFHWRYTDSIVWKHYEKIHWQMSQWPIFRILPMSLSFLWIVDWLTYMRLARSYIHWVVSSSKGSCNSTLVIFLWSPGECFIILIKVTFSKLFEPFLNWR